MPVPVALLVAAALGLSGAVAAAPVLGTGAARPEVVPVVGPEEIPALTPVGPQARRSKGVTAPKQAPRPVRLVSHGRRLG